MSSSQRMPLQVWILTLSAFAIGTAEFVIAGILTQVAESLNVTEGQAGNLISAYALAIVFGGPLLTLWLSRYEKRSVLIGLMILFIVGNIVSAMTSDYTVLLVSRFIVGLTQGPFYGVGAVVATKLVPSNMAGRAIGQMFAGLTLANVLGVPGGASIGNMLGWNMTFLAVAFLGLVAMFAIGLFIPRQEREAALSVRAQLSAFRDTNLLSGLLITTLTWSGFMTFYGYIGPIAENIAGFSRASIPWLLVIVGIGLVIGNVYGGKTADKNLRLSLIFWPIAMILSLLLVGYLAPFPIPFTIAAFIFGVASFANVPSMQMRVMTYGAKAPELTATANISAFNIANTLGGVIGGLVVDSSLGAGAIPFIATLVPLIGLLFILTQDKKKKPPSKIDPVLAP